MTRPGRPELRRLIGRRVRLARELRDVSQRCVAACIGISPCSLCSIESGKTFPCAQTLVDLATALQTTTDYLVGRTAALDV